MEMATQVLASIKGFPRMIDWCIVSDTVQVTILCFRAQDSVYETFPFCPCDRDLEHSPFRVGLRSAKESYGGNAYCFRFVATQCNPQNTCCNEPEANIDKIEFEMRGGIECKSSIIAATLDGKFSNVAIDASGMGCKNFIIGATLDGEFHNVDVEGNFPLPHSLNLPNLPDPAGGGIECKSSIMGATLDGKFHNVTVNGNVLLPHSLNLPNLPTLQEAA
eukprot:gene16895-23170_t